MSPLSNSALPLPDQTFTSAHGPTRCPQTPNDRTHQQTGVVWSARFVVEDERKRPEPNTTPLTSVHPVDPAPLLPRVLVPLAVLQPDPDEAAPDPHHNRPSRVPHERVQAQIMLDEQSEQSA